MFKIISKIIFNILFFFDVIFMKLFKKSYLIFFKDFFELKSYTDIEIFKKKIKFFTPNSISKWRVDTFFTKEPETLEWIDGFDGKNKIVFWDIGANIGLYSIYAAIKHNNIKVISFEPSTSNLRLLSRNISVNKLEDKVLINQMPLSDKENQYQTMNEPEFSEGHSMNTFGKNLDFEGKTFSPKNNYKIIGTSINYLIKNNILDFPNYIKIDVDGIEHIILRGARDILSDIRLKSIALELNEEHQDQFREVQELMKNSNFFFKQKKEVEFVKNRKKYKLFNYIFNKNEH
mgnify:CR=1 FL=1